MKTLKIPVINQEAEKTEEKPVSFATLKTEVKKTLLAQAVLVFLSNQRHSRGKARTRGEVTGSTVKIWKQKGTGRARHGDRQAPIFVGGGKAHGPTGTQNYHLILPQKMSKKAILGVLNQKISEKNVFLLDSLPFKKTKEAFSFLNKAKEKLSLKGRILFLCGHREEVKKIFRNLSEVEIFDTENINVYRLLRGKTLFLTQQALSELEGRLKGKNEKK